MFKYFSQAALLAIGVAAGQGVSLLLAPVLTRLVNPQAFGVFSIFLAMLSVLSTIATLGYEPALVTLKRNRDVDILSGALLWVVLIVSLLSSAGLVVIAIFFKTGFPWPYFLLMAPALFTVGSFAIFYYRATRNQRFQSLGVANFINNVGKTLGQLVLVILAGSNAFMLILGDIVGRLPAILPMAGPQHVVRLMALAAKARGEARRLMRENIKFLKYTMTGNLLDAAVFSLLIPMAGWFYGAHEAGLAAFMLRIISGIGALIAKSCSDVYHSAARHHAHENKILRITAALVGGLVTVMIAIWAVIYALGDEGFTFIFGPEWKDLGAVALVMGPIFLFGPVSHVFSRFTMMTGRQEWRFYYYLTFLACAGGLALYTHIFWMPFLTLLAIYSGMCLGLSLLFLGLTMWRHGRKIRRRANAAQAANNAVNP